MTNSINFCENRKVGAGFTKNFIFHFEKIGGGGGVQNIANMSMQMMGSSAQGQMVFFSSFRIRFSSPFDGNFFEFLMKIVKLYLCNIRSNRLRKERRDFSLR